MSRCILGLSAYFHDSAAAILVDGVIVAAAQEERFSRKKHDAAFPARAVEYCLREAGIGPEEIDYVVFYEKPLLKFERLLETYLAFAPRGLQSFLAAMPSWLKTKLRLPREIRKALGGTGGVSAGGIAREAAAMALAVVGIGSGWRLRGIMSRMRRVRFSPPLLRRRRF